MTEKNDYQMQVTKEKEEANGTLEAQQTREREVKKLIAMYLRELGMPTHLSGYRYVSYAIAVCIDSPEKIHAMTKELYPETGKKFRTTGSRVERAIRSAVDVAWERGDLDAISKIFGNTVSSRRGRPTNSEFIAMIAEQICINYQI